MLFFLAACGGSSEFAVLEPGNADSFVLLELFTSQGCSSCPPADRQLNGNAREYAGSEVRVFTVAWHVAYWDSASWTDPFSDVAYSRRQGDYAELSDGRTYTPQLVVQGAEAFVGSAAEKTEAAKVRWIAEPGATTVAVSATVVGGAAEVEITVEPEVPGADLQVVVLESGISVDVEGGENSGRTLKHENVVRSWVTVGSGTSSVSLGVPGDVDLDQASVLVFLQDRITLQVVGAASVPL